MVLVARRHIYGIDSQVCLGCLTKGRASSVALNRELTQSIPHVLAYDTYSELGYFRTSGNPADDPTRGVPIRLPSRRCPTWWKSLASGQFEEFDVWMKSMGLDPDDLSGLPPFSELYSEDISGKTKDTISAAGRCSVSPELPTHVAASHSDSRHFASCPEDAHRSLGRNVKDFRTCHLELLNPEAASLLSKVPKDQFILPDGYDWPPTHRGFLDLFSGERGVAKELASSTGTWVLCYDIAHDPREDLDSPETRGFVEAMVRAKCFYGLGLAPVCASFSVAITPPCCSSLEPYGKVDASDNMKAKMDTGNSSALWVRGLCRLALLLEMIVWLENPWTSWMFRLPEFIKLRTDFPQLGDWVVDYYRFSRPWRKRTRFMTNCVLKDQRTLCLGCEKHQLLRGRSKAHRKSWTLVAQAYPSGVARAVALGMAISCGLVNWSGKFDPASCAKAGKGERIGEASNPGPKVDRSAFLLDSVPLVEAKTAALQSKTWKLFLEWVCSAVGRPAAMTLTISILACWPH